MLPLSQKLVVKCVFSSPVTAAHVSHGGVPPRPMSNGRRWCSTYRSACEPTLQRHERHPHLPAPTLGRQAPQCEWTSVDPDQLAKRPLRFLEWLGCQRDLQPSACNWFQAGSALLTGRMLFWFTDGSRLPRMARCSSMAHSLTYLRAVNQFGSCTRLFRCRLSFHARC